MLKNEFPPSFTDQCVPLTIAKQKEREKERGRESETERETERDREGETERDRDRDREIERLRKGEIWEVSCWTQDGALITGSRPPPHTHTPNHADIRFQVVCSFSYLLDLCPSQNWDLEKKRSYK